MGRMWIARPLGSQSRLVIDLEVNFYQGLGIHLEVKMYRGLGIVSEVLGKVGHENDLGG